MRIFFQIKKICICSFFYRSLQSIACTLVDHGWKIFLKIKISCRLLPVLLYGLSVLKLEKCQWTTRVKYVVTYSEGKLSLTSHKWAVHQALTDLSQQALWSNFFYCTIQFLYPSAKEIHPNICPVDHCHQESRAGSNILISVLSPEQKEATSFNR